MASIFNAKHFNTEVFQKYIDRIPNPRLTELLKSRAIRPRPELAQSMRDEVGGNFLSTPLKGLISGSTPMTMTVTPISPLPTPKPICIPVWLSDVPMRGLNMISPTISRAAKISWRISLNR